MTEDAKALTAARMRVRERLMERDDWQVISRLARDMRSECNRARMTPEAREAFVWSELDRLYPPKAQSVALLKNESPQVDTGNDLRKNSDAPPSREGRVSGLSDLPPDWPDLPANASLAAEVGWVQAERLRIVEEKPGGATVVTLNKARAPAPSWAALSWLETSIRSYAKFVEVAAKVAQGPDDVQALVKRERMAIEEIRSLLAEMVE